MIFRRPRVDEQVLYDLHTSHPLQSFAWGEFREKTGVRVRRLIGFDGSDAVSSLQITFHPVPKLPFTVGYLPKGPWPDEIQLDALRELGQEERAIFIKLEPNVSNPPYGKADIDGLRETLLREGCREGRALFTPYTFTLDLTQSDDELMAKMKKKTRYNIGLAKRSGVVIAEQSNSEGFEAYLKLLDLTTKRQGFYSHDEKYHRNMWKVMSEAGIAKILTATYEEKVIAAWILFIHNHTLYYPYGASSREHKQVMAPNLLMWEAIQFGKRNGCRSFDLWGALGPDADPNDPWFGFHRFKAGYGGVLTEFVGSYDLVLEHQLYPWYRLADYWRWKWLRFRSSLRF